MDKYIYFITKYGGLFKLSVRLASCEEAAIWSDDFHFFPSLIDRQPGSVREFRFGNCELQEKDLPEFASLLCYGMTAEHVGTQQQFTWTPGAAIS